MKNSNGMKKYFFVLMFLLLVLPAVTFSAFNGVSGLLTAFKVILGTVIPIIFGIAFVYFFWGMAQFILKAGDVKTHEEGKQKMIWGIVALFVMFSVYGILRFIGSELDIPVGGSINIPTPTS